MNIINITIFINLSFLLFWTYQSLWLELFLILMTRLIVFTLIYWTCLSLSVNTVILRSLSVWTRDYLLVFNVFHLFKLFFEIFLLHFIILSRISFLLFMRTDVCLNNWIYIFINFNSLTFRFIMDDFLWWFIDITIS